MRGECSPDAAPGCAPASRSSGRLRDCPPRSSPVGPGRFVQPRRTSSASRTGRAEQPPGAPSALSPSSSAPLPGLRLWSAGRGASTAAVPLSLECLGGATARPKALPRPARVGSERHQVCLCGVSRGRRATCTSPAAGAAGKTRRGGGPGEEQRRAARLDLFARDGRRARGSPTGAGRSHRASHHPARAAEAGGLENNCVAAEVLGAAGPGVPGDVALNAGARTGGSRSSRAPSSQCAPPSAPACVASGPIASRFCLASQLNFPRRD